MRAIGIEFRARMRFRHFAVLLSFYSSFILLCLKSKRQKAWTHTRSHLARQAAHAGQVVINGSHAVNLYTLVYGDRSGPALRAVSSLFVQRGCPG